MHKEVRSVWTARWGVLSAQVLVPTLPSLLHCSTIGMQARSKARSVSIMHSSIIPACVIPFKKKKKPSFWCFPGVDKPAFQCGLAATRWQIYPNFFPTPSNRKIKIFKKTTDLPCFLPFVFAKRRSHTQICTPNQKCSSSSHTRRSSCRTCNMCSPCPWADYRHIQNHYNHSHLDYFIAQTQVALKPQLCCSLLLFALSSAS